MFINKTLFTILQTNNRGDMLRSDTFPMLAPAILNFFCYKKGVSP